MTEEENKLNIEIEALTKRVEILEEEMKHKEDKLSSAERKAIKRNIVFGPFKPANLPKIKDPLAKGKTIKLGK